MKFFDRQSSSHRVQFFPLINEEQNLSVPTSPWRLLITSDKYGSIDKVVSKFIYLQVVQRRIVRAQLLQNFVGHEW